MPNASRAHARRGPERSHPAVVAEVSWQPPRKEGGMAARNRAPRSGNLKALAVAAAALGALAMASPPAAAQPYLGWDFGNGFGIGVGPPPSAYEACPNYGWPVYPYRCAYRHVRHVRHYRRDRRY
jgi:hypothetical protein